jgi:hypothetical protein
MKNAIQAVIGAVLFGSGATVMAAPTQSFVHAQNPVTATAACLVLQDNSSEAISGCLCEATGDGFDFCGTATGEIAVNPDVRANWAAALGVAGSQLSTKVNAWDDKKSKLIIDARAECTLNTGDAALQIDVSTAPSMSGVIGGNVAYSAVYMWPTVGGEPAGDPVRLCALGAGRILAAGKGDTTVAAVGPTVAPTGPATPSITGQFSLDIADLGFSGGFQWAAENVRYGHDHGRSFTRIDRSARGTDVGVQFVVVAGVGAAVLNAAGADTVRYDGVAALARAKLKSRSLLVQPVSNLSIKDVTPPPG